MALSLSATVAGTTQIVYNSSVKATATVNVVCNGANKSAANRSPCTIVAVIDVSGSMIYSMELVKETLLFTVANLSPYDSFAMVTFGDEAKTVFNLQYMDTYHRQLALEAINNIEVEGLTFLSGGLHRGLKLVSKPSKFCNNDIAVLLLTDGYATRGTYSLTSLLCEIYSTAKKISKYYSLTIHTFGYCEDHDHVLLRGIADEYKGIYYYVKEKGSIAAAFAECLGGIMSTFARNVTLIIQGVNGVSLGDIDTSFKKKVKSAYLTELDLEDIGADEQRNILVSFTLPSVSAPSPKMEALRVSITYDLVTDGKKNKCDSTVFVERILPQSEGGKGPVLTEEDRKKEREVDQHRNRLLVAAALEKATMLGTSSNFISARAVLQKTKTELLKSVSSETDFTKYLIEDIDSALEALSSTSFQGHGAKYMYSLARSHYTQRSSGISTSSASYYLTEAKKQMIRAATGEEPVVAVISSSSSASKPEQSAPAISPVESNPLSTTASNSLIPPKKVQTTSVSTAEKLKAIRRLMRDLKEVEASPLSSVVARPIESDVFEWHCCLRAPEGNPYRGIIFHIILNFPEDYPMKPPTLFFCSDISHKHVFRSWVCLDLLEENFSTSDINAPYTGWSSAYSVQTILLQLQSFLFDEAETSKAAINKARASAQSFTCPTCNHTHSKCWPSFPNVAIKERVNSRLPRSVKINPSRPSAPPDNPIVLPTSIPKPQPVVPQVNHWSVPLQLRLAATDQQSPLSPEIFPNAVQTVSVEGPVRGNPSMNPPPKKQYGLLRLINGKLNLLSLSDDILINILSYFRIYDLHKLSFVSRDFYCLCTRMERKVLHHFFSSDRYTRMPDSKWKQTLSSQKQRNSDGLICFHSKLTMKEDILGIPIKLTKHPSGEIKEITSTMDLISYEAFYECGIRKTVWKESFTHWMPLYINKSHFQRAATYFRNAIRDIATGNNKQAEFEPEMVLDVLPRLMTTMVVKLMSGNIHASIVALEGYCAFHRLLLQAAEEFPQLKEKVNQMAINFCSSEEYRTKAKLPNLGDFLSTLSICDAVSWEEVCLPYLQENFDRNVLWAIKKYPFLGRISEQETGVNTNRITKTFDAVSVSLKLLVFNVYFFKNFSRPENLSLQQIADAYDVFFGRPSDAAKEALQRKCKEILRKTRDYNRFFLEIGMKEQPTPSYLSSWLRQSVRNSERKGYHTPPPTYFTEKQLYSW